MAFEIIASLNTTGSIKEISEKLSNEVNAGVNAKQPLKIVATINERKTIENINNVLNGINGLTIKNLNIDAGAIQNVQKQIANVTNKNNQSLQQMTDVIAQPLNKEELSEQYRGIQQQEQALQQYGKTIDSVIGKLNRQSNLKIFDTNNSNSSVVAMRTTIGELVQKYEQLKSTIDGIKTPEQFKKFETELTNLNNQFNKATESAKNLQRQFQNDNSSIALGNRVQSLRNQITKFMSDNGKAMNNGYRNQFDTMLNSLNTVANTGDFNKIKSKFQELTGEINRLGLRGNSVMDSLRQKVSKFASWMGITMITSSISREIRGMYEDVITLDTALVDLNKTFQGTQSELEDVYNSSNKIAKELGVTTEQVINQASSWSRLG